MSSNVGRFTPQNKTTHERLSTHTVGLVALSDFRKRRVEVLEQQEREAREALLVGSGSSTPNRSLTGTPAPDDGEEGPVKKKKKKKAKGKTKGGAAKLSFADEEDDEEEGDDGEVGQVKREKERGKLQANTDVGIVPKAVTKAVLRREAAEREALRREFLQIQDAVKATEIAIPFVFYDGSNIPGGIVRVKKGDHVWVFLDKSRKVGAELGVGEKANARREWARVGVDDLILVRGTIIIPHHYDFYFFVINKTIGPGGTRIFDFSSDAPQKKEPSREPKQCGLITAASKAEAAAEAAKNLADISTLEGASDDPTLTKVVDRRWYERNKHIYPASVWQEFDPEKDYVNEIRRDTGGNAFFYSR